MGARLRRSFVFHNCLQAGADRLLWALSKGVAVGSHYSGCAGDLCWTPWIVEYLQQYGLLSTDAPVFVVVDATDIAPNCQTCLVHMDPSFKHVFGDMFGRAPSDLMEAVFQAAPNKGGDKEFSECQHDAVDALFSSAVDAPGSTLFSERRHGTLRAAWHGLQAVWMRRA